MCLKVCEIVEDLVLYKLAKFGKTKMKTWFFPSILRSAMKDRPESAQISTVNLNSAPCLRSKPDTIAPRPPAATDKPPQSSLVPLPSEPKITSQVETAHWPPFLMRRSPSGQTKQPWWDRTGQPTWGRWSVRSSATQRKAPREGPTATFPRMSRPSVYPTPRLWETKHRAPASQKWAPRSAYSENVKQQR